MFDPKDVWFNVSNLPPLAVLIESTTLASIDLCRRMLDTVILKNYFPPFLVFNQVFSIFVFSVLFFLFSIVHVFLLIFLYP